MSTEYWGQCRAHAGFLLGVRQHGMSEVEIREWDCPQCGRIPDSLYVWPPRLAMGAHGYPRRGRIGRKRVGARAAGGLATVVRIGS